jgi:hypothetical protein
MRAIRELHGYGIFGAVSIAAALSGLHVDFLYRSASRREGRAVVTLYGR